MSEATNRRSANYGLLKGLAPFTPSKDTSDRDGTSGNIQFQVNGQDGPGMLNEGKSLYELVSSPMLLSRLCAGFEGLTVETSGQSAYKITWFVALVHSTSGIIVTFYDWKGAASIGSSVGRADGQFRRDLELLLRSLTDDAFPHPYDGCRVGEMA